MQVPGMAFSKHWLFLLAAVLLRSLIQISDVFSKTQHAVACVETFSIRRDFSARSVSAVLPYHPVFC